MKSLPFCIRLNLPNILAMKVSLTGNLLNSSINYPTIARSCVNIFGR
ncbi:MAG: hypothetical protein ACTS80_00450 [Candidatus Hodgkinia cicadicola]